MRFLKSPKKANPPPSSENNQALESIRKLHNSHLYKMRNEWVKKIKYHHEIKAKITSASWLNQFPLPKPALNPYNENVPELKRSAL